MPTQTGPSPLTTPPVVHDTVAPDTPTQEWSRHKDAAGFTVEAPAGWHVQVAAPSEIAISDPLGFAAALVRVRRLPQRVDLAPWLARQYAATEPGLHNVRMLRAEGRGPRVASAAFDYGSNVFQGRASAVASREGDIATIFIAAAARDQFARFLPTLVRILDSFRFDDAAAARGGRSRYAPWADPYEGSMLGVMPDGWRANGGVLRSAWSARLSVTATSPDDLVHVFFGDPLLPRRFIVPAAAIGADTGPLGSVFPGRDSEMVLPYQRADVLGTELVRSRFEAEVRATRPRHELVYVAQRHPSLEGAAAPAASAADIDFRLEDGRVGVLTMMTFGVRVNDDGGQWWADGVHGFIAPPERRTAAVAALLTLVASLRENPQRDVPLDTDDSRVERDHQDFLAWLRDLQQAVTTARLLADDAREESARGAVPAWPSISGVTLEKLLAIGNIVADR